jgi:hypothetical protein
MISITRNGIGGLAVRIVAIALAVIMFGCMPKEMPAQAEFPVAAQG